MAEDTGKNGGGEGGEQEIPEFLQGTPFKTPDELAKGYQSLTQKLSEQGNELGSLRKQSEVLTKTLESLHGQNKAKAEPEVKPTDYAAERAGLIKQIESLDPMDDGYQAKHAKLLEKVVGLTAAETRESTLNAAKSVFSEELNKRDVQAAQKAFKDAYPDFDTPEMQSEIQNILANDRTGMHDTLSAFFQARANKASAAGEATAKELEELKRLKELESGKANTGKVITKGVAGGGSPKPQQSLTGKDLDAAMMAALHPEG